MPTNILWKGIEYNSLENCLILANITNFVISSAIVGYYKSDIFRVEYKIVADNNWHTLFAEVISRYGNEVSYFKLESDGKGQWNLNGNLAPIFNGCIDIDIPLTPFTNTLPIKRLKPAIGETKQVKVIYLDIPHNEIKPVNQQYTHSEENIYQYQNIPNDFEASVKVDQEGFVIDYPSLFTRVAVSKKVDHGI